MVAEKLTGLLPSFSMSGVSGFLFNVIMGLLGLAVVGFMIWFIYREFQYKYKVTILEELSNGGTLIAHTRGRIKRRSDKTEVFLLKGYKDAKLAPPPLDAMEPTTKGKKEVFVKKFGNGSYDYYPIGISLRGLQVYETPFLTSRQNWISTEIKRQHNKYGSFWEKYGGMVMLGGMVVFTGVVLIIVFKMNAQSIEAMTEVGDKLAQAMANFKPNVQSATPPLT